MLKDTFNSGVTFDATHPFHLHGHSFAVLGMERVASNVTVDLIREMDANGLIARNFLDPPIKDTVSIPDGGYVVVRFLANNPGNPITKKFKVFYSIGC